MSLDRFHAAQDTRGAGYEDALAEIRHGRKTSHWIWFVFPQIEGLGRSSTACAFALRDLAESCDYLNDPILRQRYEEIAAEVLAQIRQGVPLQQLMGSSIDALKLISSVTLFQTAARRLTPADASFARLVETCQAILDLAAAQGYPPCAQTLARLAA